MVKGGFISYDVLDFLAIDVWDGDGFGDLFVLWCSGASVCLGVQGRLKKGLP
jgi:hypothetical protein